MPIEKKISTKILKMVIHDLFWMKGIVLTKEDERWLTRATKEKFYEALKKIK